MKTKLIICTFRNSIWSGLRAVTVRLVLILALSPLPSALGQVPQGFNYQAIARDASGNPIINATIKVKLSILKDTVGFYPGGGGIYLWEEEQTGIKTNTFGLFTVVFGNPSATQTGGSATSFSAIDWAAYGSLYIGTKIANPDNYKVLGAAKLWSVPYSMVSDSTKSLIKGSKLSVVSSNDGSSDALFEVKRKDGQTVFAVYPEAVNVYIPIGIKGTKGGFAIGGFDGSKTSPQDYFRVTRDSVRIYIDQAPKTGKGATKGGFAIGGFDQSKSAIAVQDLLTVSNDSVRIYINRNPTIKGATKGGFAIGGFAPGSKGLTQDLLTVSNDSIRMYIDKNPASGKGTTKGGFAIGSFGTEKGTSFYMNMTPKNYFIGESSGQFTTGLYNSFLGYESGILASTGEKNVFLGYHSGMNNVNGSYNVFLGNETGLLNQGSYNTFLGFQTGYSNTTGSSNCFFGQMSGNSNQDGNNNVFIGNNSGFYNVGGGGTKGSSNVFIGNESGYKNQNGSYNCFIGYQAGHENTADYNSFIGYQAGLNNKAGNFNAFMGYMAGKSNIGGVGNVFIGEGSGISNQNGSTNTFVGTDAGSYNDADFNTFLGFQAGYSTTTGDENVFIGYGAAYNNKLGIGNTVIGQLAGEAYAQSEIPDKHDLNYDVFLGDKSGRFNSGSNNVFLGYGSGYNCQGNGNVLIGYQAGQQESGNNRLIIENSINIATPLIYGEFDNKKLRFNAFTGVNTDAGSTRFSSLDDRASDDTPAIQGQHNVTAYCGIGVEGIGGWIGVKGESTIAGGSIRIGVLGNASGGDTNYGVYGTASGGTAYAAYFVGNVNAQGIISSYGITLTSDRNFKKNILPMSGSLKKILDLQGVTYEWNSEEELASLIQRKGGSKKGSEPQSFNFPKGTQLGVIAQDVEKVLPELVHTDADGLKSVDYIKIIPVLIEAIKEQQKEIDELKNVILSGQTNQVNGK